MNRLIQEYVISPSHRLQIVEGDLTEEHVDAIVNAANAYLQHAGGVARAISRRGGPQIQVESNAWVREHGMVKHSEPAYTQAGDLSCRYVIHAVGPVWGEGDEDAKLAAAIHGALKLADRLKLSSIAFPAISTGIFGFPMQRAAEIMLDSILGYFAKNLTSGLQLVRLTLYDLSSVEVFLRALQSIGKGEEE